MANYGELPTGWRGKTFDEVASGIRARMRARIDQNLTLDEKDWLGNAIDVWADEAALIWEAIEVARNQFDPDNVEGQGAVALSALTGTRRLDPSKGTATCQVNLAASKTFAPGDLVAHVNGEPGNRWVNRDTVTSTTAGNYTAVFVSETAGYYPAAINTITRIAQTASGWNSITNTAAATPGKGLETIPELMVRRESELGATSAGTIPGLHNAVAKVPGVIGVKVNYNDTTSVVGSLQPNQLEVVVWDGTSPAASNNAIAQAILENKSGGATLYGSTTGTAYDHYGVAKTVAFNRAASTNCYCNVSVLMPAGTVGAAEAQVIRDVIAAAWPTGIGETVYASQLIAAVMAKVPGVINVSSLTVGTSPSPTGSTIAGASNTVRLIPPGNITPSIGTL